MAERIELHTLAGGVTRVRAWSTGNPAGHTYRRVEIGTLADGRWFARDSRRAGGAYVVATERAACDLADRWMATSRQEWTRTPARFDANGQPCDGLPWRQSGGNWFPGEGKADTNHHGEGS